MNDHEIVRIARLWMADGPTSIPDRTLTAALSEVQTTAQRRPGLLERIGTMKSLSLLAAASVAGIAALLLGSGHVSFLTTTPASATISVLDRPLFTVGDLGLGFSSDGSRLFVGRGWPSNRPVATIYDARTGAVMASEMPDPEGWGIEAFSPDGSLVAIGGDGTGLYDMTTGVAVGHLKGCCLAAFSPDGRSIAIGGVLYDVGTSKRRARLPFTGDPTFSPDGKRVLLSGRNDDESAQKFGPGVLAVIADATKGGTDSPLALEGAGEVSVWNILGSGAAWSPDATMVAQPTGLGNVLVWDSRTGALLHDLDVEPLAGDSEALSVAFSPDSQLLVAGTSDGQLVIFDLTTEGSVPVIHRASVSPLLTVAFSPDGSRLMAGSEGSSGVWELAR